MNMPQTKGASKKYPHTIGHIYKILEIFGHTNKVKFNAEWKNRLKRVYFIVLHCVLVSSLGSHVMSTFTRSIRSVDEFLHRLFEDLVFNLFYFYCNIFIFRYAQVQEIVKSMETSFSVANVEIVRNCYQKGKSALVMFFIISTIAVSGSIVETFFPASEKELKMIRYVYRRKHPERRFQTNFYIPFVEDDSESPYYEAIWITELPLILLFALAMCTSGSFIPTLVTHIEGQYKILCGYVELLGRTHFDTDGNRIIYTDIVKNQYLRIDFLRIDQKNFKNKRKFNAYQNKMRDHQQGSSNKREKFRFDQTKEELYQLDYCRQIVKFHNMLIQFQEKMVKVHYPFMLINVIVFNLMFALCLYQIFNDPSAISQTRVYRVIGEFFAIAAMLFSFCHCSERLDSCTARLYRACNDCAWWRLSPRVRRTLMMILRRAERKNHFPLSFGTYVLDYVFFVSVAKLSYSFVNFMRFRTR